MFKVLKTRIPSYLNDLLQFRVYNRSTQETNVGVLGCDWL